MSGYVSSVCARSHSVPSAHSALVVEVVGGMGMGRAGAAVEAASCLVAHLSSTNPTSIHSSALHQLNRIAGAFPTAIAPFKASIRPHLDHGH